MKMEGPGTSEAQDPFTRTCNGHILTRATNDEKHPVLWGKEGEKFTHGYRKTVKKGPHIS
jgi:hypothetical protein